MLKGGMATTFPPILIISDPFSLPNNFQFPFALLYFFILFSDLFPFLTWTNFFPIFVPLTLPIPPLHFTFPNSTPFLPNLLPLFRFRLPLCHLPGLFPTTSSFLTDGFLFPTFPTFASGFSDTSTTTSFRDT